MRSECKWFKNDLCHRFGRHKRCKPSDGSWFNYAKPLHPLWADQICEMQNPLSSEFLAITEKDIEALREGRVLYCIGDAPIFIALKGDDDGCDPNGI